MQHSFAAALLAALALSAPACCEEGLGVGPWRLGMSPEKISSFAEHGPYSKVRVTGGLETENGTFKGRKVNTSFVFDNGGLEYIQVWNYEGGDWQQAREATLEVFDYFTEHYGGATISGVTLDGDGAIDRGGLQVVVERILSTAHELNEKAKKDKAIMTITFDMVPVKQPKESRLHCQWVYAGRFDQFFVFLFQDRPDAPSRNAPSTVQLEPL